MNKPLAFLLRPNSVKDIVGQEKILSENGIIAKMIEKQFATSLIFYGPPGTGKTSLALAIAKDLNLDHDLFNASYDKKEKLAKIIDKTNDDQPFILIIDEIHRMNKDKQDLLLEHMEKGNLIVFFTTTENPFFVINPAIHSRATIIKIEPINNAEMFNFFQNLIQTKRLNINITDEALQYLCQMGVGDLRSVINHLELLINLYPDQEITLDFISQMIPLAKIKGTGYGDDFHDLKSALQKSIRGSDVDAALHYFARLVKIGDFETLMRRMVIIAYEDIGLANPNVPMHVLQATNAFRQIGAPEGIIPLGLAIIEMSLSEKSNSAYLATTKAINDVENGMVYNIPDHLKDTHYQSAKKLGHGIGYKYAHNYHNDWVEQQYLPNEIKDVKYYKPKQSSKYETKLWELYEKMKYN
ncbi:replication-associated recombination protein A [Williamsoniiplasma luminosum]|uniref:Replication-associated recombination protein A n=1 Tax=Williamsoniiplasma luminosum TaxID=214888 RepID=A0A2S0NJJ0_9MOLU|nr:replication-associated recombination protein A [Williamsoniiplasma luminosum]AVP49175.1 MAG: replication-associated recombination protein A [Williamsoniiplasma luminosum]